MSWGWDLGDKVLAWHTQDSVFDPKHYKPGVGVQAGNLNTYKVEVRGSRVQEHPRLHIEFEASLKNRPVIFFLTRSLLYFSI